MMISLSDRFKSFVSPEPLSGCWLWTGGLRGKGYGNFRVGKKSIIASRMSYRLYNGPIGDKLVCHSCNTPSCVAPHHLYLGTYSDNTQQAVKEQRQFVAKGILNGEAKLSEHEVLKIRDDPRSQRVIAKEYNISQLHVSRIKRKLVWKHL